MLHFSEQALATINHAMQSKQPAPRGLRLGVVGSPCSGLKYIIRLEEGPASDDQVIECQGLSLFVDLDSVTKLQGVRVDYVEQDGRRGFTFDNPQLAGGCSGCNKASPAQQ